MSVPFVIDADFCDVQFAVVDRDRKLVLCRGGADALGLVSSAVSSPEGSRGGVSVVKSSSGLFLAVRGELEDEVLTALKTAFSDQARSLVKAVEADAGGRVYFVVAQILTPAFLQAHESKPSSLSSAVDKALKVATPDEVVTTVKRLVREDSRPWWRRWC